MTAEAAQPKKVLRVSEVTGYIKQLMERDRLLALIQVQGELTNLSRSGSGWIYFTIKDAGSQLGCVISARQAPGLREELSAVQNGVQALLEGSITVYEPGGRYQLMVNRMRLGGAGAAKMHFDRLRRKLDDEGLFASERKRQAPRYPRTIVLVTAPDSQAYHDVVRRIELLWPRVTVVLARVAVQGEQAAAQIATAIDIANRSTDGDVLILARGGGSAEELDAFNDERLARAIFASRIPVITGIGHTKDLTIADLVADVSAPTPTAAAVAAVPDGRAMVAGCRQAFRSMRAHTTRGLNARRAHLIRTENELMRLSPTNRVAARRQRLDELWTAAEKTVSRDHMRRRERLRALQLRLDALNPMAVLGRGYALLTDVESGVVVASTGAAVSGRKLRAQVKDGEFGVVVSG